MNRNAIEACLQAVLEELADVEHQRWARWQGHLHARCERRADGALVIPAEMVARWDWQIAAAYSELSEAEKESDRQQVRLYLPVIIAALEKTANTNA